MVVVQWFIRVDAADVGCTIARGGRGVLGHVARVDVVRLVRRRAGRRSRDLVDVEDVAGGALRGGGGRWEVGRCCGRSVVERRHHVVVVSKRRVQDLVDSALV